MPIRPGLLTLLAAGPSYGYQLRSRLEARAGGTWPLNMNGPAPRWGAGPASVLGD